MIIRKWKTQNPAWGQVFRIQHASIISWNDEQRVGFMRCPAVQNKYPTEPYCMEASSCFQCWLLKYSTFQQMLHIIVVTLLNNRCKLPVGLLTVTRNNTKSFTDTLCLTLCPTCRMTAVNVVYFIFSSFSSAAQQVNNLQYSTSIDATHRHWAYRATSRSARTICCIDREVPYDEV